MLHRMKPRHAVALALVGWYLLMPPLLENDKTPRSNAPLSQWIINQSFDTADLCEQVRLASMRQAPNPDPAVQERRKRSVCVETDDPRLAK